MPSSGKLVYVQGMGVKKTSLICHITIKEFSLHYMKRNKTTIVVLLTLEDLPDTIFLFYRVQMDRSLQQKEQIEALRDSQSNRI